jgi:hypothetical protein
LIRCNFERSTVGNIWCAIWSVKPSNSSIELTIDRAWLWSLVVFRMCIPKSRVGLGSPYVHIFSVRWTGKVNVVRRIALKPCAINIESTPLNPCMWYAITNCKGKISCPNLSLSLPIIISAKDSVNRKRGLKKNATYWRGMVAYEFYFWLVKKYKNG